MRRIFLCLAVDMYICFRVPCAQKYYSSSPGKTAPEITVDNCEDDFEQDEDDDDDDVCGSPRIGSWEWCRLRGASPLSGLVIIKCYQELDVLTSAHS